MKANPNCSFTNQLIEIKGGRAMGDDVSEAELADRVNKALEAYALKKGAKSHIWICVTEDNGPVGGCSPNLRPYGPGLMDEVEKATGK